MIFDITTDITSAKVDLNRLSDEVEASSISPTLSSIRLDGSSLDIQFGAALSSEEETTLTALVLAHSGEPYPEETAPSEVKIVEEIAPPPFAAKELVNGQKLFKRVHGVFETIPANTSGTVRFVIPYNQAKINGLEILGASHGDTANFNVYDNAAGTISTIPDYKLNQFGFSVCMAKDFHEEKSQYDADVILGMVLELEFTNNQESAALIGANFIIHELV